MPDGAVWSAAQTLWSYHCIYDPPAQADVIVGLGSYDLRVADRCAELFAAGLAPGVIFSGAVGNWTEGAFEGSEAAAFAGRAQERGVPRAAIRVEARSTNIGENLRLTARMVPEARTVAIVTKPQTQRRVRATADLQWPRVRSLVTAPVHRFEDQPLPHHGFDALVAEMLGDLDRMRRYPALGFQSAQPVPVEVARSERVLLDAGYSGH